MSNEPVYVAVSVVQADPHPAADGTFMVTCYDKDGRFYWHNRVDLTDAQARKLATQVIAAGRINLDLWHCHIPYGSRAWDLDGMEATLMDDEERYFKGF